jgi:hypothetical protein
MVYDLLLYLLERRDHAFDKNELQYAAWSGVFITEAALMGIDGYSRFFSFIVRDEVPAARIHEWMGDIWPAP